MNLFWLFAIRGNKIDLSFNYNSKVLQYLYRFWRTKQN